MLKQLEKCVKSEKKNKDIFDIILYGSFVKGKIKPRDLDILVIFEKGALKERLNITQKIKRKISKEVINIKIDIKTILLKELFDKAFFAKTGIFLEGISIFDGRYFSEKIGFKAISQFEYNLINKTHTQKVKFNYILKGRNDIGMIKRLSGKHLAPGIVQIPIKHSQEFEDLLKMHNINFIKKDLLLKK